MFSTFTMYDSLPKGKKPRITFIVVCGFLSIIKIMKVMVILILLKRLGAIIERGD